MSPPLRGSPESKPRVPGRPPSAPRDGRALGRAGEQRGATGLPFPAGPLAELPAPGLPPSTLLLDTPALSSALPQGTPPAPHTGSVGTP